MNTSKVIKTDFFEGPIEALLSLVEERKLPITEVALAKVTDAYISLISGPNFFNTEYAIHFLQVASTLLLIKSRELLPELILEEEEEKEMTNLANRLEIYKAVKEQEKMFLQNYGSRIMRIRHSQKRQKIGFFPSKNIKIENLQMILNNLIKHVPADMKRNRVALIKSISINEAISAIKQKVIQRVSNMMDIVKNFTSGEKHDNKIVVFLAVLEMVRSGQIKASQKEPKGDILLTNI